MLPKPPNIICKMTMRRYILLTHIVQVKKPGSKKKTDSAKR